MTALADKVDRKTCRSRHRWLIGTLLSIAGLTLLVVTWAVGAGRSAENRAAEVDARLSAHEAGQAEHEKSVDASLHRIESKLERMYDKVVNGK